jgi:hypothetical protein
MPVGIQASTSGGVSKCWLSCERFTVLVEVDGQGTILWAAPVVQRLVGLRRSRQWMETLGGSLRGRALSRYRPP